MPRDLTCARLFERNAKRVASWGAPQSELRDAGLPGAKRRDADSRGVFFCFLCLHEQEKGVACRGETRPLSLATLKQYQINSCLNPSTVLKQHKTLKK